MIALAYAVPTGVIAGWSGVLDMILTPAKVSQVGKQPFGWQVWVCKQQTHSQDTSLEQKSWCLLVVFSLIFNLISSLFDHLNISTLSVFLLRRIKAWKKPPKQQQLLKCLPTLKSARMPPESEACYQPAELSIYLPYLCTDSEGCFFQSDLKFQRWCEIMNPESLALTRGACFSVGSPPDCLGSLWGLRPQAHECTWNPKL